MLYRLARPALFALDPERAHGLAIAALKALPGRPARLGGPLETTVAGLTFPNPLGMAAGFDKDGEAPDALLGRGFGSSRSARSHRARKPAIRARGCSGSRKTAR